MQSDFVGHLISEIASDMRGMLARQRCFMLLSMLAPSNLGQMSNRSNPIFEHQLCVCVLYMYCARHIFGNQYMRPVRFPWVFLHIFPYRILHLILPIEVWLGPFQRPGVRFRAQRYVEGGRVKVDGASNCGKGTLERDHNKPSTFWAVSFSAGIPCAIQ